MRPLIAHGRLAGLDELADVGVDQARGGYSRHLWDAADLQMRAWFVERADELGLGVEHDRNGNIWAWLGEPRDGAVVTGSHLDSVPGGGAFDGPLGVVSALEAVGRIARSENPLTRPLAVVVFAEEEGSRFGVACLGSGLLTGQLDPRRVRGLTDVDGTTFARAAERIGFPSDSIGADPDSLARIGLFIELHVEQGRSLEDLDRSTAVADSILAHGRWTMTFRGQGNHAGTTRMADRDDPMIAAARAILEVRDSALCSKGGRATVGRITAVPGGANVIPSLVTMTLDARADTDEKARAIVDDIARRARSSEFIENSWSSAVQFDPELRARVQEWLGGVPVLSSGAGHDAGVLAGVVPTAMIFVRNPTGISHAPEEFAELDDCLAGIDALETVLRELVC